MFRTTLAVFFVLFVFVLLDVRGQDAGQRSREIAASLDKNKYKKKEKANVSVEVYVDIKNEPVLRTASDYAGNYQSEDNEFHMTLTIDSNGSATGAGRDLINGDRRIGFTLQNARIDGALLTGTKVYENGEQQKFEAVFVNRTIAAGKNVNEIASRDTKFGVGFIQSGSWSDPQKGMHNWTSRVFLERR